MPDTMVAAGEDAVVGEDMGTAVMVVVGVVGNLCIKKVDCRRNLFHRLSATRSPHQVMGHRPRLPHQTNRGRSERPLVWGFNALSEQLQVMDLFVVPSVTFELLYVFIIVRLPAENLSGLP